MSAGLHPPPEPTRGTGSPPRGRALIGPVAALILLVDQMTKLLVDRLVPVNASVPLIDGFLNVTHVRNTGAAFGLLNAAEFPFKPAVMTLVALVALAAITLYVLKTPAGSSAARLGFALILGGACGNLLDRIRMGYVVDFIDVYWRHHHFWAFNVADSAITVGAGLLVFDMLGARRDVSQAG
jgi:signal peptidase II